MMYLPLANILHHKLRSFLAAMGIGIGICMLITLTGLARGSLNEVADRWESVNADLIVLPSGWGEQVSTKSGSGLSDGFAGVIARKFADQVESIVPVFLWRISLAGQDQMTAGIDAADWATLTGDRPLTAGRMCDPDGRASQWLAGKILSAPAEGEQILDLSAADLGHPDHNCLELVIDERLAKAGGYSLGQIVRAANHDWRIVGIAPEGVITRVFMPRRTAQFLFASGDVSRSTLMFVKLKPGAGDLGVIARRMRDQTKLDVLAVAEYRGMLTRSFGIMFVYVNMVNVVALIIAFLFIMVILYTMVLQRTRDIAILKANGASNGFLIRQVVAESILLTAMGVGLGIALSFLSAWIIQAYRPLLTVVIEPERIGWAVAAAGVGALASSLYPAWRATRVDMAAALSLE